MQSNASPGEVAAEWLRRAKGDLAMAKAPKPPESFWEDFCFHAQQAAEKAVKAVFILHRIDFPRTHDITELLALLGHSGWTIPREILEAGDLTSYAVETRYPGIAKPVTESEYRQAVAVAEKVVQWAEGILSTK